MKRISVIVPCYNEEEVLPQLFQRLTAAANAWGVDYEVICVDDGSSDATWNLLQAQSKADARWRGISLARNFGHQTAISAGLYSASGDAAVIVDADLQDPPEEVSRLLARWREGFEVVFAVRTKRPDSYVKRALAWCSYRLIARLSPLSIPTDTGDFCLLDRKVIDVMNALPERNRYLRGLRTWCGFKQASIEFERGARAAGVPKYTYRKLMTLALDGLLSFSTTPLRLATYLGLAVSVFAFLGAAFSVVQRVFAQRFASIGLEPSPGFPTTVIAMLFLGGVQLICLGILGEYIGRIYDEVRGRPLWIVRESTGINRNPSPLPGQASAAVQRAA
jgi:dolichol-phosphate mannosyltransferase